MLSMSGIRNVISPMPKLVRITTVPLSLHVLLKGQMRYMRENGFDVIMVSDDGKELEQVIKDENCTHIIVPMTREITPVKDLSAVYRLTKLFKKLRPDIVHSHTPKAGLLAMMAAKYAGVPVRIHTVAGLRFMTVKGNKRRLLINMEKLTARFATHVWPNSKSLLAYIKKHRLSPERKLEVIGAGSSNGIDLSRYSETALDNNLVAETKKQISYDESLFYFLSAGRIVKDKGIEELVPAFVKLYEESKQARLILVGSFEDNLDPVSEEVRKIISEHPAIITPGWSHHIEYFMHLANVFVHPSHREGFPNVLLQAGAMFCPVICSRIEGNIDIVEDERTGLLFDAGNEDQLLERMHWALKNAVTMNQYSNLLRKNIEENYSQPVVHAKMLRRYKELL